jgi:hypothetical protein
VALALGAMGGGHRRQVVFFWWRVPETKGRSLEEIERDLGAQEQAAAGS